MAIESIDSYKKRKKKNELEEEEKVKKGVETISDFAKRNSLTLNNKGGVKDTSGLFQSSDGGFFQTIGGTIGDLATDISEGFLRTTEGIADWAQYRTADVLDLFGADETANSIKKNAKFDSTGAIFGKNETASDNLFKKGWTDTLERNSILGDTADTINQGIGNVAGMAGAVAIGGAVLGAGSGATASAATINKARVAGSILTSYTSAYGNARSEAYKNGADDFTSHKAGVINGIAEAVSEQFFDAIPGMKVEGWGSKLTGKLAGKLEKTFGTKIGKTFLKVTDALGEGAEEMISNALTATGNNIAHYTGKLFGNEYNYGMENQSKNFVKDFFGAFTSEESLSSFFSAAMTSALIGGGNNFLNAQQKNTILKEYAKENNMSTKEARTMLEKTVGIQTETLAGKENFNDKMEVRDKIESQELQNMKRNVFVEQGQKDQAFQYKETNNEKVNNMLKSLSEKGNNSVENHETAQVAQKLIKDLGYDIKFTNNVELKEQGKAENAAGYKEGNTLVLNLDSNELSSFVMGHETTHFFESIEGMYDTLSKTLFEVANMKGIHEENLARHKRLYADYIQNAIIEEQNKQQRELTVEEKQAIEDDIIKKELTADYAAQFFTDKDFFESLGKKNPSILQKFYNFIEDLINKLPGRQYQAKLKEAKNLIREVYNKYSESEIVSESNSIENKAIQEQKAEEGINIPTAQETKLEQAETSSNKVNLPIAEEFKPTTEKDLDKIEKQYEEDSKNVNRIAPNEETEQYDEDNSTKNIDDPLYTDGRTWENVGKRNVKAYQYEHPEVKPYFQEEAANLLWELDETNKGERFTIDNFDTGERRFSGTKRNTSKDISKLLDDYGFTYSDIEKGLKAIIDDNGAENIAVAKRLEFVINDRLMNGYERYGTQREFGDKAEPNQEYLKLLEENEWNNYYDSIPESTYNLPTDDTQYMLSEDNKGHEIPKGLQERMKDSKARDEEGRLKQLYHGTATGEFYSFDKSMANPEGDWGAGFYLTDNESDVGKNYEDGGPDFENRIARLAEQISGEQDIEYDEAEEIAREQLYKGSYKISAYIDMKNPAYVGKTYIFNQEDYYDNYNMEDYESEDDYYADVEQLVADDIDSAIWAIQREYDIDYYEDDIRNKMWEAYSNGGMEIEEFKNSLQDIEIDDGEGRLANHDVARIILESLGYDGIIDDTVSSKWNMDMESGTTHYIAFKENQIKDINNENPTDNNDIRYMLSDNTGRKLSEGQREYFKDESPEALDKNGNIEVMYHTTPNKFTIFDKSKLGDNTAYDNTAFGFFITPNKDFSSRFGDIDNQGNKSNVMELYAHITKPITHPYNADYMYSGEELDNIVRDYFNAIDETDGLNELESYVEDSDYNNLYEAYMNTMISDLGSPFEYAKEERNILEKKGYDAVKFIEGDERGTISVDRGTEPVISFAVFNSNQIKNVDNLNPTENDDIRYLLTDEEQTQSLYEPKNQFKARLSDGLIQRPEENLPVAKKPNLQSQRSKKVQLALDGFQDVEIGTPTRHEVIQKNRELAREKLGDITKIKDKKKGILYQINTMKRNLRDIMTPKQAKDMYDTYFKPITENNAEIEKDITSYNERIQKYNLTNEESIYTQLVGELKYNPESELTSKRVEEYYNKNSKNIDKTKVNKAVEEFRNIYDELISRVNDTLVSNGYKPIEYRKGYFPHFIEEKATSPIGKLAEKLGWKVKSGQLPTDIAGITDQFKPGKAWTSFSQHRTSDATDYNALKGLDNYLRGAMDVIHHTEDIQKLRALENEIRYQYSDKGIQEKIDDIYADDDLDMEEKNEAIYNLTNSFRNSSLGNFATEIRNYTDSLANKKSFADRSMEQALGRDTYSIMQNINGRVNANMVGANIGSALTNFIPITQAWSQVSTKNLMKGMYEATRNTIKNDGFDNNSVFLTNRTQQADRLYKTGLDKVNDKLGVPFEAIDEFTSNTIVRAKYYDNIEKGMSEQEAISNADEFAKDVMAGRSKGDMPTIINQKNPVTKLFTAFQLEVNNQFGYMFKDIPADLGGEAKKKLAAAFVKMFFGAWLYNYFAEKITGRKSAFSPIDMAIDDIKTATNDNMDLGTKISTIAKDTAQELPFVGGLMGGGRLPIQGAIPYENPLEMITGTISDVSDLFDKEKKDTAIKNITKEWSKPLYYVAMPFAGGQLKKTVEGLSMYDDNLPVAGSYTNSGKLRFEADKSPLGVAQAAIFGQYANKNARDYFDNGYSPLTEKQVNTALEAGLGMNEYREYNSGINAAKKVAKDNKESQTEAAYNYIANLPLETEQKNALLNSTLGNSDTIKDKNGYIKYVDSKNKAYWLDEETNTLYNRNYHEVDISKLDELTKYSNKKNVSDYSEYGSLEEFNYYNSNPEKYSVISQITDFNSYNNYKDDIEDISDKYSDLMSNATTSKQKTAISNKKKQEVFSYINSLNLNKYQKTMLYKIAGGYSIKTYKNDMYNYINSLDLSAEEKKTIYDELFN